MRRLRGLAAAVLAAALGCTPGLWDLERLEAREPALASIAGHRLGDLTPYLLPHQGFLTGFACRWGVELPIPVSLPPDASASERSALDAALRAWEGAGLGVRFVDAGAGPVGIEIRFVDASGVRRGETANTIADCRVDAEAFAAPPPSVLPARLVWASIHLRRSNPNTLGREMPLSQAEIAGSALHELGHALGFQGHARRGDTVMDRSVDTVRSRGRGVLMGESFEDATLRALYAIPSGTVLRRVPLAESRSRPVDAMRAIAPSEQLLGPLVRVGDSAGRIAWRNDAGIDYAMVFFDPRATLRRPSSLTLHPTRRTQELIETAP